MATIFGANSGFFRWFFDPPVLEDVEGALLHRGIHFRGVQQFGVRGRVGRRDGVSPSFGDTTARAGGDRRERGRSSSSPSTGNDSAPAEYLAESAGSTSSSSSRGAGLETPAPLEDEEEEDHVERDSGTHGCFLAEVFGNLAAAMIQDYRWSYGRVAREDFAGMMVRFSRDGAALFSAVLDAVDNRLSEYVFNGDLERTEGGVVRCRGGLFYPGVTELLTGDTGIERSGPKRPDMRKQFLSELENRYRRAARQLQGRGASSKTIWGGEEGEEDHSAGNVGPRLGDEVKGTSSQVVGSQQDHEKFPAETLSSVEETFFQKRLQTFSVQPLDSEKGIYEFVDAQALRYTALTDLLLRTTWPVFSMATFTGWNVMPNRHFDSVLARWRYRLGYTDFSSEAWKTATEPDVSSVGVRENLLRCGLVPTSFVLVVSRSQRRRGTC